MLVGNKWPREMAIKIALNVGNGVDFVATWEVTSEKHLKVWVSQGNTCVSEKHTRGTANANLYGRNKFCVFLEHRKLGSR